MLKHWVGAVVVLPLLLGLVGCGNSPGPEVRGVVTLDGEPLADAEVQILPSGGDTTRNGALTRTDAQGKFEIAPDPDTGATLEPGQYNVVISKKVDRQGKVPQGIEDDMEQMEAAGMVREVLPAKYSRESETSLAAEIKPEPNNLTFDLKTK